ncbi:MAG: glycoside hydrolase family 1 protein [Lactovum sp.]
MKIKFDKNFSFGTAMSGPQTEGNTNMQETNWDKYYLEDPNSFWDNIGPKITTDTLRRFQEDVAIAKEIGLESIRTSIQWARIIKNFEVAEINQEGLDFYSTYFQAFKDAGIQVFVGLSHFDMPLVLHENYEGFYSRKVVDLFVDYAKVCFDNLSHLVDKWITFNEPYSYVSGMYLRSAMLPCEYSLEKHFIVTHHVLMAHKKVCDIFQKYNYKSEIGIVLDCMVPYARDPKNAGDVKASLYADLIKNRSFMDPVVKGEISQEYFDLVKVCNYELPIIEGDLELIKSGKVDFIGVNYYRPERVKAVPFMKNPEIPWGPEHLYQEFIMPKSRQNKHRGWEIYPKALYDLAMRVKNDYNNIPWYVSENGMGVENEENYLDDKGQIQDDYRIEFISEHLYWLHKAIEEGSNCFAYHLWTFIDNWSWRNAYKNRYGYVSLDLKTRNRRIKKSGYWMKKVIETREVDLGFLSDIE